MSGTESSKSPPRAKLAHDAIPADAIRLTDAFSMVVGGLLKHPEIPASQNELSLALLERSIELNDDVIVRADPPLLKKANLFFRERLSAGELSACVRDPETGDILRLETTGWIPDEWIVPGECIQSGIFSNHVQPGDYETPGPAGTNLRGALRPVFFMVEEFVRWFQDTFGPGLVSLEDPLPPLDKPLKAHRRSAVEDAIRDLYQKNGPPPGLMEEQRMEAINEWLKSRALQPVGKSTIQRALKKLRSV